MSLRLTEGCKKTSRATLEKGGEWGIEVFSGHDKEMGLIGIGTIILFGFAKQYYGILARISCQLSAKRTDR